MEDMEGCPAAARGGRRNLIFMGSNEIRYDFANIIGWKLSESREESSRDDGRAGGSRGAGRGADFRTLLFIFQPGVLGSLKAHTLYFSFPEQCFSSTLRLVF